MISDDFMIFVNSFNLGLIINVVMFLKVVKATLQKMHSVIIGKGGPSKY